MLLNFNYKSNINWNRNENCYIIKRNDLLLYLNNFLLNINISNSKIFKKFPLQGNVVKIVNYNKQKYNYL